MKSKHDEILQNLSKWHKEKAKGQQAEKLFLGSLRASRAIKNLAYAECPIMKFHYRNSSNIEPLINAGPGFFHSFILYIIFLITNIPYMLFRSLAESTQSTQSSRVSLVLCLENLYLVMFLSTIKTFLASCKQFCERLFCLLL